MCEPGHPSGEGSTGQEASSGSGMWADHRGAAREPPGTPAGVLGSCSTFREIHLALGEVDEHARGDAADRKQEPLAEQP